MGRPVFLLLVTLAWLGACAGSSGSSPVEPNANALDGGAGGDAVTSDVSASADASPTTCTGAPVCILQVPAAHAPMPVTTADGGPLHPHGFIGDPSVLFENGVYRMWFTSSRLRTPCTGPWTDCLVQGIAYAESADGVTFRPHLEAAAATELTTLVFEPPLGQGAWEETGIETASVVRGHDGRLRMFYTGHMPPVTVGNEALPWDAIGVATSDDGIVWKREGSGPVLQPTLDWERVCCDDTCGCRWGGVLEPSVVWDAKEKIYRMWYAAVGELGDIPTYRIGYATSSDGLSWSKQPSPVLLPGAPGSWDEYVVSHVNVVADPCAGYHLFFHGYGSVEQSLCDGDSGPCNGYTPGSLGYAFSKDGVSWTKAQVPLLRPLAQSWNGFFVGGPSALFHEGALELFYFGNRDLSHANAYDSQIGRTVLSCGAKTP